MTVQRRGRNDRRGSGMGIRHCDGARAEKRGTYVENDEGFSLSQTIPLEILGAGLEYLLIDAPYHLSHPAWSAITPVHTAKDLQQDGNYYWDKKGFLIQSPGSSGKVCLDISSVLSPDV